MATLPVVKGSPDDVSDPSAVLDALGTAGGVIVHDMLGADAAELIKAELADEFNQAGPGSKSGSDLWETFHGARTVRLTGLAARSETFVHRALLNPTLLAVADALLLPHAADYWLNTGQVMAVGPGEPAQFMHRDENNWPEVVSNDRELTISAMFALSDFRKDNGATVVQPGSQRLPAGVRREPADAETEFENAYAEMPAGSAMIYTGKVVHGAGANKSDDMRYGLHVSFVLGWLRPEEASPLMVDQQRAAALPSRARELLGWSSYHSNGGGRTWLVDFEDASRLFG